MKMDAREIACSPSWCKQQQFPASKKSLNFKIAITQPRAKRECCNGFDHFLIRGAPHFLVFVLLHSTYSSSSGVVMVGLSGRQMVNGIRVRLVGWKTASADTGMAWRVQHFQKGLNSARKGCRQPEVCRDSPNRPVYPRSATFHIHSLAYSTPIRIPCVEFVHQSCC